MMLTIENSVKDVLQDRVDPLISCGTALYARKAYQGVWYYLWKHETTTQDTWLVSYGTEQKQDVFLVSCSQLAAEQAYSYAVEHGLMHVKGYLV
jgi:hypothetical protein